jgi:hypothetical protein
MANRTTAIAIIAATLTLSACIGGGGPPKPSQRFVNLINRVLTTAPGEAQPSTIVATEVAMEQAEEVEGVWPARARFAAPGAIWHTGNGPLDAATRLASMPALDRTADWGPRTVVMSCDGALAVAQGRFRSVSGKFGTYVTTWQRQADNTYKWIYNTDWLDDPQPPPRAEFEDGEILVTSLDSIMGLIASCPRADAPVLPPPEIGGGSESWSKVELSADGTLRWRWVHHADGARGFVVDYFYEGGWQVALAEGLASPPQR